MIPTLDGLRNDLDRALRDHILKKWTELDPGTHMALAHVSKAARGSWRSVIALDFLVRRCVDLAREVAVLHDHIDDNRRLSWPTLKLPATKPTAETP